MVWDRPVQLAFSPFKKGYGTSSPRPTSIKTPENVSRYGRYNRVSSYYHNGSHSKCLDTKWYQRQDSSMVCILTYMAGFFSGNILLCHTCILWAILVVLHMSIFSITAHAFWILSSFWINKQQTISRPAELPCRSCRSSACSNATSTGGKQGFAQGRHRDHGRELWGGSHLGDSYTWGVPPSKLCIKKAAFVNGCFWVVHSSKS